MKNALNLTIVEGNLTRDPELLYTKNGNSLCKFDIAVNFTYKQNDTEHKEVSYITVTVWHKLAEACAKYLKKGSLIRVKGRLKQEVWATKEGTKKQKILILAETIDFLGSKSRKKVA